MFGECMSHQNTDLIYVNIPKNASSWTKKVLQDIGWEFYNYHTDDLYHKHACVVIRNPIERWVSGIAEYMYLYHRNLKSEDLSDCFFDLVFNRIAYDDHTEQQILFLEKLDKTNCTFFMCDKNYKHNFSNFLNENNIKNSFNDYEYIHVTDNDVDRKYFKNIFESKLKLSDNLDKLNQYFQKDFDLINTITFYSAKEPKHV